MTAVPDATTRGARWIRYEHAGMRGFGTLDGDTIAVHAGDMFGAPVATGETVPLSAVTIRTPTDASKYVCLWNNFAALGAKLGLAVPATPLFLIKAASSYAASGDVIRKPRAYDGRVIFEAELGIVIGRRCTGASEAEARDAIFGYTCINDVTAFEIINEDPSFGAVDAREEFRGVRRLRPRHRDGARSRRAHDPCRAQR